MSSTGVERVRQPQWSLATERLYCRDLRLAHHPTSLQDIRGQAPGRLCPRAQRRMAQGQHATGVPGAIARERVGLVWAMATEGPLTLERPIDPVRDTVLGGGRPSDRVPRGLPGGAASPGTCHRPRARPRPCGIYGEGVPRSQRRAAAPVWGNPVAASREPTGTRVPRDGGRHPTAARKGGQPTESRRINRRVFLARLLHAHRGQPGCRPQKSCSRPLTWKS
jgi:hypothetical protein